MNQKIKIFNQDDPLNDEIIELDVPRGTRILSNETYAEELFGRYMQSMKDSIYVEPVEGTVTKARVISIERGVANIEINSKHTSFLNFNKEDKEYHKYITVGNEIYVKLNKREGNDVVGKTIWKKPGYGAHIFRNFAVRSGSPIHARYVEMNGKPVIHDF